MREEGERQGGGRRGRKGRDGPCASGIDPGSTADRTTCCSCFKCARVVCGWLDVWWRVRVTKGPYPSGAYRFDVDDGMACLCLLVLSLGPCAFGSRGVAVHLEEEEKKVAEEGVSDLSCVKLWSGGREEGVSGS